MVLPTARPADIAGFFYAVIRPNENHSSTAHSAMTASFITAADYCRGILVGLHLETKNVDLHLLGVLTSRQISRTVSVTGMGAGPSLSRARRCPPPSNSPAVSLNARR